MRAILALAAFAASRPAAADPITISFACSAADVAACETELQSCLSYPTAWSIDGTTAFACACWLDAYRCFSDCAQMPADFVARCGAACPNAPGGGNVVCKPALNSVPLLANTGGVSGATAAAPAPLALALAVVAVAAAAAAG
jgi:hypothetical protein